MNSKRLKQFTVLLVEDEKKLASLLKDAIGNYFYNLKPDIVITDITMPKMTGLQMASKIKEINENIPIIILSAFSDTDKLINAIDVGVVKYFIKPFDPDELLEYIDKLTRQMQSKIIQLLKQIQMTHCRVKLSQMSLLKIRSGAIKRLQMQGFGLLLKD